MSILQPRERIGARRGSLNFLLYRQQAAFDSRVHTTQRSRFPSPPRSTINEHHDAQKGGMASSLGLSASLVSEQSFKNRAFLGAARLSTTKSPEMGSGLAPRACSRLHVCIGIGEKICQASSQQAKINPWWCIKSSLISSIFRSISKYSCGWAMSAVKNPQPTVKTSLQQQYIKTRRLGRRAEQPSTPVHYEEQHK